MEKIELYIQTAEEELEKPSEIFHELTTRVFSTAKALEQLQKRLLVMRLSFGKLRASLMRLIAPFANLLLPVISRAVIGLSALFNRMAKVATVLFGGADAGEAMSDSQKTLATSLKATAKELARFDTLDRIGQLSAGGEDDEIVIPAVEDKLSTPLAAMAFRIYRLLQPLKRIDLTSLSTAFEAVRRAAQKVTREVFYGLEWAWTNLLVPLSRWVVEDALPVFLNLLTASLDNFRIVCQTLEPLAQWLLQHFLQPIGAWTGQQIIGAMEQLTQKMLNFTTWVEENEGKILSFIGHLENLSRAWNTVSTAVKNAWQWLHPQEDFFSRLGKNAVNGVISMVNAMLSAVASGINALVKSVNKISFTVPDWVPLLGGEKFGFNLKSVAFPKIPYLAQGAVLPANKPFLAVVGDQKNGTNIEAPLSTIRQALAEVLAQQGAQRITVEFAGDLAQLGRVLRPVIRQEEHRAGVSLAKGVAV